MDQPDGTVVTPGLLPSVDVYKPGLTLLFKQPSVDRRYALDHIDDLSVLTRSKVYASFTEMDLSKNGLDFAQSRLRELRQAALKSNRLQFVFSPLFAPRQHALMDMADSAFIYMAGYDSALIVAAKIDGQLIDKVDLSNMQILRRRVVETKPALEGQRPITITVSGTVHSGRSAVSAIIQNALRDKWPHLHIDWQDPDNSQALVLSNLAEGRYDSISATSFKIVNETVNKKDLTHEQ